MDTQPPSEYDAEGEEDMQSAEELSASLRIQAKKIEEIFLECHDHFMTFHRRICEEMEPIDDAKLVPKERMKVWLETHRLPEHVKFQEFFEAFLHDHKREGRLDLSNRSVDLNADARILLGFKRAKKVVPILDLLELLTNLFE